MAEKKLHPVVIFLLGAVAGALLLLAIYKLAPSNTQDDILRSNIIIPSGFTAQEEIIIPSGTTSGQNIIIPSGFTTTQQIIIPSGIVK